MLRERVQRELPAVDEGLSGGYLRELDQKTPWEQTDHIQVPKNPRLDVSAEPLYHIRRVMEIMEGSLITGNR